MSRNLSNLFISESFQFVTQISGSELQDGLGNTLTGSLLITASLADFATSSSFATSASQAQNAVTASFALNVAASDTGSLLITASVSNATITYTKGDGSTFTNIVNNVASANAALTADIANEVTVVADSSNASRFVTFVDTTSGTDSQRVDAGLTYNPFTNTLDTTTVNATTFIGGLQGNADTATSASFALIATSSSFATNANTSISSSFATSASQAQNAVTASFALNVTPTDTGSLLLTASINDATTTFTKGDGSTFDLTVNNVVNADSASLASNAISSSFALIATSSSFATNADTAISSSFATSASQAQNAVSSSFALTASFAENVTPFDSGSLLTTASINDATITFTKGDATTFDLTVNNVVNADSASVATSASFATTASFALNAIDPFPFTGSAIISGSLVITGSLTVSGSSTFTNIGPAIFSGSVESTDGFTGSLQGTAATASNTPNALVTASAAGNIVTFTKGDASTFNITVDTGSAGASPVKFGDGENTVVSTHFSASSAPNSGDVLIGGADNIITSTRENNTIIGGEGNILDGISGLATGIFSSYDSKITNGGYGTVIIGGINSILNDQNVWGSAMLGGQNNAIAGGNAFSFVVGGEGNKLVGNINGRSGIIGGLNNRFNASAIDRSVIIGGQGQTAIASDTVYVPNLQVSGSATVSGSVLIKNSAVITGSLIITSDTDNTALSLKQFGIEAYGIQHGGGFDTTINIPINAQHTFEGGSNSSYFMNRPFTIRNSTVISSSLQVTGSTSISGSLSVTGSYNLTSGSFSGSLINNITDTFATPKINSVVTLTQAEYNAIGIPDANTLFIISGSTPFTTSGLATTGSNTFVGNQIISGSLNVTGSTTLQSTIITGSLRGEVNALSISSQTASFDCSTGNFYTLLLVSGSTTFVNPSNIEPGQTINLKVKQASVASGSIAFPSTVKQLSGSLYIPTGVADAEDIVTFISFDGTNLYLSNVNNLV